MNTLIEDTILFLKLVAADNETPENIKAMATALLNSWEYESKK